jgi:hypothetical protein
MGQKEELTTQLEKDAYQACFEVDWWNNKYDDNVPIVIEVLKAGWGYKKSQIKLEECLVGIKAFRDNEFTRYFQKAGITYAQAQLKILKKAENKVYTLANLDNITQKIYDSFIREGVECF